MLLFDAIPEGLAFHVRHDVEQQPVGFARIENRKDVRMGQPRSHLDLAKETFCSDLGGNVRAQNLYGNGALMPEVASEENNGHAPFAEGAFHVISAGEARCEALLEIVHGESPKLGWKRR